MVTAVALGGAGKEVGVIVAALAASGTLLLREARWRAVSALVALALTPVLVIAELWSSRQVEHLRGHGALAALVGVVAVALMAGLFLIRK